MLDESPLPLPPKCGLTYSRGVWHFSRGFAFCEFTLNEATRPIIAAIAEVEWRKRAERWKDVYYAMRKKRDKWYGSDWKWRGEEGTHSWIMICQASHCKRFAEEWREWGAQTHVG